MSQDKWFIGKSIEYNFDRSVGLKLEYWKGSKPDIRIQRIEASLSDYDEDAFKAKQVVMDKSQELLTLMNSIKE